MTTSPIYRRQASSGTDHRRDEATKQDRDHDAIPIDPNYHKDGKTGYIPGHDLSKVRWTGGGNK